MPKLYEISNSLASILGDVDDEISDDLASQLSALELAMETKVENILQFRQSVVGDADAIKAESERLKARADALTRKAEWLKTYVLDSMRNAGVTKITTTTFTATVAKSPPAVKLADGADIPQEYRKEEIKVTLDRQAVLADAKAGKELPVVLTVAQGTYLRIS